MTSNTTAPTQFLRGRSETYAYRRFGSGPAHPLLFLQHFTGTLDNWDPAVTDPLAADREVILFESAGLGRSSGTVPKTVSGMAAHALAFLDGLRLSTCDVLGFSLGGIIVQELLLAHPDLVTQAILMASRGRTDALRAALATAESEFLDSGIVLPPRYAACIRAMQYLSPEVLNDEQQITDWLDIFEIYPIDASIQNAQRGLDNIGNRLEEYRKIRAQCMIIAFGDDLMVPPYLCREVAESIPDCAYEVVAGCGHYGYLEKPELVNEIITRFFRASRAG